MERVGHGLLDHEKRERPAGGVRSFFRGAAAEIGIPNRRPLMACGIQNLHDLGDRIGGEARSSFGSSLCSPPP